MKILVISPHTDDETLGAGGFLLKHADEGDDIFWMNVTNTKQVYGYSMEDEIQGKEEASRVALRYGVRKFIDLELEPAGLDKYRLSELIQVFSEKMKLIEPDIVLLPYPDDIHSDHRIVFEAAFSCTKAFRYPSIKKILCMEIISETDYALADRGGGMCRIIMWISAITWKRRSAL